mmetsp:Transcript_2317/g.2027  ORF Transcript_2317/g.2027 Transcript_2317/m.2027 type:complete len:98 (-) Transcript_2317:208-501(-)
MLKFFGSIEILGNPSQLYEKFRRGFVDLFIDPCKLCCNGKVNILQFGKSLAKGMKSFVFNTASGISSMIYRIFRATMKGMSLFTADRSFIILRHQIR